VDDLRAYLAEPPPRRPRGAAVPEPSPGRHPNARATLYKNLWLRGNCPDRFRRAYSRREHSTLDRASRSTLDGAILLDQARRQGWRLLSVDGVDSDDPEQTLLTDIRLAVAQEERRKISERTKAGLEAARAKGKQLGRPSKVTPALARRIVRLRMKDGLSAQKIAANLTTKKVPAPGGGATWHHSTVRLILAREGVA
jgi:hypothetical protein